jgi:hypothetical protein
VTASWTCSSLTAAELAGAWPACVEAGTPTPTDSATRISEAFKVEVKPVMSLSSEEVYQVRGTANDGTSDH